MDYFVKALQEHQELAIFLCLALGFDRPVKIGSFNLGTVVGTLLAGLSLVSSTSRSLPPSKTFSSTSSFSPRGTKWDPIFPGLKKDALPQLVVTVVLCVTCLLSAFFAAKILGYDVGPRRACWQALLPNPR